MSEAIVEMIVPGTYIEVRAEGLLSVGGIATGNVGVIGTAEMGSADIQTLSSFEEGRVRFGEPGPWALVTKIRPSPTIGVGTGMSPVAVSRQTSLPVRAS